MKVILQGKGYVAIHKPSGLVTYADSPEQKKISALDLLEKQLKRKLFPVHRLDKDTCGVLVFAFTQPMASILTEHFRSRVVKKKYLAIVHGLIPEKGVMDQALERHKEKKLEPAITNFQRLSSVEVEWEGESRKYSLVLCEPSTGRFHQIRRHLRKMDHPIIGDPEYGNSWDNERFLEKFKISRTLLSAISVHFPDRELQKMVRVQTQPDADFLNVVKKFGWKL